LYQQYCVGHTTPQNIDRRYFIRERGTLRGDYLEVACDSPLVTNDREIEGALGGHDCFILDLGLAFQNSDSLVKPAAKLAGITKTVGWHTFRHSYSSWLRANHADVKVQSELLRHSNIGTTLNIYTQAVSDQKRAAHGQVVEQLLSV
jgi:hypothetical protein